MNGPTIWGGSLLTRVQVSLYVFRVYLARPKYGIEEQTPQDKTSGTTPKPKIGNLGLKVAHWYFCVDLCQFVFWLLNFFICCLHASLSSCHFLQKCSECPLLSDSERVYRKQYLPKYKVIYKSKTFLTSSLSKEVATHLEMLIQTKTLSLNIDPVPCFVMGPLV